MDKLQAIEDRYAGLEAQISDPEVISRQEEWRRLTKEHAGLGQIISVIRRYRKVCADYEEAQSILEDKKQSDLHELAREQLNDASAEKEQLEHDLILLMMPKDPRDERNVILEIRAGTGGEEAALFAGDLLRMYMRFAEKQGWKTEIADISETALGGCKEVVCTIEGKNAYSLLKYESGVHRVQRVPETESSGRIHTSAVTVAVLPEAEEIEAKLDPADLQIDTYRASGAGGQYVNKTESAIRIVHKPTGIMVTCQDEKSQLKNKEKAMKILRARIYDKMSRDAHEKMAEDRKSQVGSGDRSERIRTYNFPQGRVTDHRIGLTLYHLSDVLDGNLTEILEGLIAADRAEKMRDSHE